MHNNDNKLESIAHEIVKWQEICIKVTSPQRTKKIYWIQKINDKNQKAEWFNSI